MKGAGWGMGRRASASCLRSVPTVRFRPRFCLVSVWIRRWSREGAASAVVGRASGPGPVRNRTRSSSRARGAAWDPGRFHRFQGRGWARREEAQTSVIAPARVGSGTGLSTRSYRGNPQRVSDFLPKSTECSENGCSEVRENAKRLDGAERSQNFDWGIRMSRVSREKFSRTSLRERGRSAEGVANFVRTSSTGARRTPGELRSKL